MVVGKSYGSSSISLCQFIIHFLGADVTHPGPGVLRPSVAALVASIDEGAAKYVSRCAVQGPRTEIIQDLEKLMSVSLVKLIYGR